MKTLISLKEMKTVCIASHQHWSESRAVYGRFGSASFVTPEEHAQMAILLEACMKEGQSFVVCFLVSGGNKPPKIH
jgi:hypothetical protein